MKKKIITISITAVVLAVSAILAFFVFNKQDINYSQIQYNYFNLKTENYFIEFYSGEREENYIDDGISSENVDFGLFKLVFSSSANRQTLKAKINGEKNTFFMEQNPFDNSYMCDINMIVPDNAVIEVLLEGVDKSYVKLNSISKDFSTDYKKAMQIGEKNLSEYIKYCDKNNLKCEAYLTIIYDSNDENTLYFWTFTIIASDKSSANVVIDTKSQQIIVQNAV